MLVLNLQGGKAVGSEAIRELRNVAFARCATTVLVLGLSVLARYLLW